MTSNVWRTLGTDASTVICKNHLVFSSKKRTAYFRWQPRFPRVVLLRLIRRQAHPDGGPRRISRKTRMANAVVLRSRPIAMLKTGTQLDAASWTSAAIGPPSSEPTPGATTRNP